MIPSFSYLRVSGKAQILTDGFPRQREACLNYANSHGIEIQREFCEKGVSGTKEAIDREALTEMFLAIKTGEVRLVLVENASRLARDLLISEILLSEFRGLNVQVISASDETDLTVPDNEPTKVLIRQILGAVSQFEKSILVQKLRIARIHKKQATGRCEGAKRYGEKSDYEKGLILKAIAFRAQGMPFQAISERFNGEGLTVREGKPSKWFPAQIQRIVARQSLAVTDTKSV